MASRSLSKKRLTNGSNHADVTNKKEPESKPEGDTHCLRKLSAVLTRVLFALHAGLALWRVSFDYPAEYLYFLAIGLACLLIEMVFTLAIRQGREYKWFCPSVLFYLMSVVPCVWLLELSRLNQAQAMSIQAGVCNNTIPYNPSSLTIQPNNAGRPSTSNRTRRYAGDYLRVDEIHYQLRHAYNLMKRIKRESREDVSISGNSSTRNSPQEGRRKKEKPKQPRNLEELETEAFLASTLADNGTSEDPTDLTVVISPANGPYETRSVDYEIVSTSASTVVVVSTTTPELATFVDDSEGINLDNLGDKIKDGFSNIEKETANLLNKTREEVTQFVGNLTKSVDAATWILLLHQALLFVLVIGRWLLPKGEITRDQLSQLLLVFIGVGADILEFVTETIDSEEVDETNCNLILHYVIYGVWSWSLLQFTLVLTASRSRKTRVGFDSAVVTTEGGSGCCAGSLFSSPDLWGILVTLFLQDVPFLATRLYILIEFNLKHQMMIFFTGKNTLVVILQIYRIIVLKLERKARKRHAAEDHEMQPLRGTLVQLARRATMAAGANPDMPDSIRDATFKTQNDGSVTVKIRLEDEETLRKKRKKSSLA